MLSKYAYLSNTQNVLLLIAIIFFVLSVFTQLKNKTLYTYIFLGLTAFFVFSFAALLDPFLNVWDERFHALVAKNFLLHPFTPTLYDERVVNMAYDYWDKFHIWLHKPPLFMWQIALSFKIFGISEYTLRLPSVVLGTFMVLITFRTGKLLVNQLTGYVAAILFISTIYILELIAGRQELDHNDFSFMAYISLSIWAFVEYNFSGNKKWIYLVGLFSGMAILCKLLVGLVVYFGWIVLRIQQKKYSFAENKDFFISVLVTVLVSLPWQVYTYIRFPVEAIKAYKFNASHFTTVIEGHGGDFWYYFDKFNFLYGSLAPFLIIPAFIVLFKKSNNRQLIGSLLGMVLIVYLFFSYASHKMPSFTIIVSMLIFLSFGALFNYIVSYINKFIKKQKIQSIIILISILTIVCLRFNVNFLLEKHTLWSEYNQYTRIHIRNKEVFNTLQLPSHTILFNIPGDNYIEAMFYTNLPAYKLIPTIEQIKQLKEKDRKIAIFRTIETDSLDYLKNDTSILFIDKELKSCE